MCAWLGTCWRLAISLLGLELGVSCDLRCQAEVQLTAHERAWLTAHAAQIRVAPTHAQLPPLETFDVTGHHGMSADYMRLFEARLGQRFGRAAPSVPRAGQPPLIEILPLVAREDEHLRSARIEPIYLRLPASLLVQQSSTSNTLADLRGKRVGADVQLSGWRRLEGAEFGLQVVPIQSALRGLQMLAFGELDGLVTLLPVATHVLATHGITNLRNAGHVDFACEFGLGVRPPTPELAGILQKVIATLDDRDHAAIQQRFFPQPESELWRWLSWIVGGCVVLLVGVMWWNRSLAARVAQRSAALQRELGARSRVETALQESEELHRLSLVEISDAVFLTDEEGRLLHVSPGSDQRLGLGAERLAGIERIDQLLGAGILADVRAGRTVHDARVVVPHASGNDLVLRVNARRTAVAGRSLLFACRDVTDRERVAREIEEQRRATNEAQRMATLGALVSSLAHELNNPNHTIMLNVPVLRTVWQDAIAVLDEHTAKGGVLCLANIPYADMRDDVLRLIDEIHQGADRIRTIVSGLREYARGHWQQDVRVVNLIEVLAAAVDNARPLLDAATDAFTVEIGKEMPAVHGNRMLLIQTFVGLLGHAAQTLTERSQRITLRALVTSGGEIAVAVHDEGRGVPEGEVAFLTKPFHHAGGSLELAMAAWIVQQHGGRLAIQSAVGAGTTVSIHLPAAIVSGNVR